MKQQYDSECLALETRDRQEALEYGVHAQAHLNQLYSRNERDLDALRHDYQQKMTHMANAMEETWRKQEFERSVAEKDVDGLRIKIHRKDLSKH